MRAYSTTYMKFSYIMEGHVEILFVESIETKQFLDAFGKLHSTLAGNEFISTSGYFK